MEHFLDCYLDGFKEAPRNTLHDARTRKEMVEYISTMINGCATAEDGDTNASCVIAIDTLIRYHRRAKLSNGNVCMMGKNHNILYVGLRLCYIWQVKKSGLVAELLNEIYFCEYTFERILIGAIFGTKAPHYFAGWKSDFDNQEDNFRGLIYFLDKANRSKMLFPFHWNGILHYYRFIDLPIESCGKASILRLSVQFGLADKVLILIRFGALLSTETEEAGCLEHILNRLVEFNHRYPYNMVSCLQVLLRATPTVSLRNLPEQTTNRELITEKYADLIQDGLIPPSRCGLVPPELKHLCRCTIRKCLWDNFNLPHAITDLPVPKSLQKYIDILEDYLPSI
ncbi:SOCS domain-containing protein stops, partial [Rhynchophorus ferrugineus]|uniref:SOCS domain-containing protein stops n=1 Tax=Rhynchophorus ferrugineus TaxID=354439 RepID=UPI003FCC31DA